MPKSNQFQLCLQALREVQNRTFSPIIHRSTERCVVGSGYSPPLWAKSHCPAPKIASFGTFWPPKRCPARDTFTAFALHCRLGFVGCCKGGALATIAGMAALFDVLGREAGQVTRVAPGVLSFCCRIAGFQRCFWRDMKGREPIWRSYPGQAL